MKESIPPNYQPNLCKVAGKRVVKHLEKIKQMDLQEEIIMDILKLHAFAMEPVYKRISSTSQSEVFTGGTCTWGLGYDSTSDDYKILKIDGKERNEVLALKSGSWRKIDDHPATDNPVLSGMDYLAFRDGALDCVDTPSNMGYLAFVHGVSLG
ncbi:hypothetical protein P3S68_031693 [Capsicum galapagoense]